MNSSLRMTTFIPFLLTIFVSTIIAYPAKIDPNEAYYFNRFHDFPDGYDGKDVRNLDGIGGGNLLRDLDQLRNHAAFYARQNRNIDSLSGVTVGNSKRGGIDSLNGDSIGNQKRNMDEIDRAGFNSFIKKRNFDEIDHTGFDGFVKRNFDEIDRVGFGSFVKRDAGPYPSHVAVPTQERLRN